MEDTKNVETCVMDKDDYVVLLMDDPEFDSNAVKYIASLMANPNIDITIDKLKEFNNDQLAIIEAVFSAVDKIKVTDEQKAIFLNNSFNATQLNLLWQGITQGVSEEDIKLLADPSIPYGVLNYVIQGLIKGYPMIKYAKGYNIGQVYEIFNAFANDVTEEQIRTVEDLDDGLIAVATRAFVAGKEVIRNEQDEEISLIIK